MTDEKKPLWKKLIIIPLAAVGAYLYRLRGGGWGPKLPRPLDQILFSLFPIIILPLFPLLGVLSVTENNWIRAAWISGYILAVIWAVVWELKGHGGTMDMGTNKKEPDGVAPYKRTLETYEYLIYPWLYKLVPRPYYDFTGHFINGLLATVGSGIFICCTGDWHSGIMLGLSGGISKAAGYAIGRAIWGNTEAGEYLSGGLRWGWAGYIYAFIMK